MRSEFISTSPYIVHPHAPTSFSVIVDRLPLPCDTETLFVHLFSGSSNCFWLDSSLVEDGLSRFSFMGDTSSSNAHSIYYSVSGQKLEKRAACGKVIEVIQKTIFQYLNDILVFTKVTPIPDLPFSFIGGYVGFFGYELKTDTCSVASHKSNTPDAAFHYVDQFIAVDHKNEEAFIVALHRASDKKDENRARSWIKKTKENLARVPKFFELHMGSEASIPKFSLRHGRQEYLDKIDACFSEINNGESYEICLTNKITANVNVDPLTVYKILRRRNPAPFAAFLRFEDISIASSSPERFLSINEKRQIESKPIKGTAPRGANHEQDLAIKKILMNDEKSRAENLMIVDLLRNDIGKVSEIGSVHVPKLMHVESYQTLHQLVSTVKGQLKKDISVIECLMACFPGGSMTGAPKIRTLEIIDRLEGSARGIYSGAIGYLSFSGPIDLNIVIRTIVFEQGSVSIGCGGAIVALSDPDDEFQEILLKARAPIQSIIEAVCGLDDVPYIIDGLDESLPDMKSDANRSYTIRHAREIDAPKITRCVETLLRELGGLAPTYNRQKAQGAYISLIMPPQKGIVLVAEKNSKPNEILAVVTLSFVDAIRTSGRYGVLQEVWVVPECRGAGLGEDLLNALDYEARKLGIEIFEVSLPKDDYSQLERIEKFYKNLGFISTGTRMRKLL